MKKSEIIEIILKQDPDIVWEIDENQYYQLIGHYMPGVDTEWLEDVVKLMTSVELRTLLSKIKKEIRCLAA